jgi:hemolysin III
MSIYKKSSITLPSYTTGEEIANSILHGIGVLGAVTGLVLLSLKPQMSNFDKAGVVIFSATMIAMFLFSTLYHAIQHNGAKRIFRKFDHSVIYIFIAGSYTPFCLSGLGGAWGWSIFGFEWFLAITGIILNIFDIKILKKIEIAVYLLMGWAIVVGFIPLIRSSIPGISLGFLLAGGIAYTLGALCYRMKKIRHNHVIWHVFVIAGTICHWFAVWNLS